MLFEEGLGGSEDARRGGRSTAEVMGNERTNRDRGPETPRADILHIEVTQFHGFIVMVYDRDKSKGIMTRGQKRFKLLGWICQLQ
jgi:hypothetical protein